jgi:protein-L-isoaspartate(D-aspartate) O-methyltransferase
MKDGGRMVIPVGSPFLVQTLTLVTKRGGEITTTQLMPVRFVPFRRGP